MKRRIHAEEWQRLRIGPDQALQSTAEIVAILAAWARNTGTDASSHFEIRPDALTPKFWSGTLDTPDFTLEVAPIGTSALNASQRSKLDANLVEMLALTTASSSLSAGTSFLSEGGSRIDALMDVFCADLQLARRKNVIRRYSVNRASVAFLKGRITFPAQCHESIRSPGRFASEWVALTEDVAENRIFKEVLLRLKSKCSMQLAGRIERCLAELESVRRSADLMTEWSRVRLDRLSTGYLSLLAQSKQLLNFGGAGIFAGDVLATAEILFTSRLFERYVACITKQLAAHFHLTGVAQAGGQYLCLRPDGGMSFEVVPDLVLLDFAGHVKAVIDTKWKWLDHKLPAYGISNADIYQILTYAAKFKCKDVVLLYPDASPNTGANGFSTKFITNLGSEEHAVHIVKIPLLGINMEAARAYMLDFLSTNVFQGTATSA